MIFVCSCCTLFIVGVSLFYLQMQSNKRIKPTRSASLRVRLMRKPLGGLTATGEREG